MRQGQNSKRPRGRGSGRRNNVPTRHQTFDSNGPSVRIRGNAYQVHEKYLAMARDAAASGDRITAENYLQHAEHYFRIINADNDGDGRGRGTGQRTGRQQPDETSTANGEGDEAIVVDRAAPQSGNGVDSDAKGSENGGEERAAHTNGEAEHASEPEEAPAPKKPRAARAPRGRGRAAASPASDKPLPPQSEE